MEYDKAIVHPNAKIGANVKISPFAIIDEHVEIGDNCVIGPFAHIMNYVKMGSNCMVGNGAVVGGLPQDLKFKGEVSYVEIGNNVRIGEFCTISRGTAASGKNVTKIGDNTFLMAYVHVAHDCVIGNHVILVSYTGLAGEVEVSDWVTIGGASVVHQFCRIGCHAMLSGASIVGKDIPPFALAGNRPINFAGLNRVGLKRRGFTDEQMNRIWDVYRVIYQSGLNPTAACKKAQAELPDSEEKKIVLDFFESSQRGVVRFGRSLGEG